VSKVSKIFYFFAGAQPRQVGLNKTLDDIRKIVGFKKLTEGTSKN
jgi:hypothetical protein